jgi:hypothetical protein
MFPYSNMHYAKHYNIGDPGTMFKSDTEYKHQYLQYPSKEYHIQLEGLDKLPKELPSTCKNYKSEERKQYQRKEEKYVPEYKEEVEVPKCKVNYKFKQPAYNDYRPKLKQEAIEAPYIEVKEVNNVPEHNEQEIKGKMELLEERYKLAKSMPSRKDNEEDKERRTRAKKYKEYLDLQIQLNNEKHKYEQLNRQQTNEQLKHRNIKLRKIGEDIIKRTREQQAHLARVYERQIQEQKISRNTNSFLEGENNFSDVLDINRQRYFKVGLFKSGRDLMR